MFKSLFTRAVILVGICYIISALIMVMPAHAKITSPKDLNDQNVLGYGTYNEKGYKLFYIVVEDEGDVYVVNLDKDKAISEIYKVKDRAKLEESQKPTESNMKLIWSLKGSV